MSGTTPQGVGRDRDAARSEQEAAQWVRGMFGRVAHRYDLANHLLSFNIDRYWRAHTVRRTREILRRPEARVLDICCGTGDLVLALAKTGRPVLGSDFCHPMLVAARDKIAARRAPAVLFESDALTLPLRDASLDLITVAFGFRNLANYEAGLRRNAPRAAARRHGGHPGILASRRMPCSARSTTSTPPHPALDRRPDLRLARCLHLPAGIGPQVSHCAATRRHDAGRGLCERELRIPHRRDCGITLRTHTMIDRDELLDKLNSGRAELLASLDGVTEEQAAVKPTTGWSILECVEHVAIVEENLRRRLMEQSSTTDDEMPRQREALIVARAADRSRKVPAPEPAHPRGRFTTLSEAVESFCRSREQTIAYISSCQDDLRRLTTDHPMIGAVSGQEMLLMMIGHPFRHAAQIRELR